ncbi:hypothetical protein SE17_18050 [Kouleothrix aurantiaca]|uniref:Methyltransferase n=1 Tax=Kouleothrix aurantiaca TaxID=186479 RepID=A0A0P9D228_9CHLR|nr:hypothetical protein SE17_18050 [Kouleothrix aurantiaca]
MQIDTTKPSVGRIYDYVLGGHHNFDVDRAAAENILKFLPSYPTWARLNRWFLQMVATQWAEAGHSLVLDIGSGLPTAGHFHSAMPKARVLYTDNDPMTVAYANEVLGNNPQVKFLLADATNLTPILATADQFLQSRQVAIGVIGVSYFLPDAQMKTLMQGLYEWAAPGSVLAISYIYVDQNHPDFVATTAKYKNFSGSQVYMRSPDEIAQLCAPWAIRDNRPLAEILGVEHVIGETERMGMDAEMFGALMERVK